MPDDRDQEASARRPGISATLAAVTPGLEATVAATGGVAIDATSATVVSADPGSTTARTVGDDLRAATIDRFGEVAGDRFELLGELARGGLGRVSRARDPRTGRIVALKEVLRPSPEIVVRFAREAMVTANLQHPSIIPVYEVGRWHNGEPFYAMKLVRGRALDAIIAEAGTTEARVALVPHVIDVADALAYAHSEHVIHRDLKPANVLVGPYGETVVIDWGVARNLATDHEPEPVTPPRRTLPPGQTMVGAVIGTPAYMAPEQAAGQPLDERADVYAIGAILYHVLAGVRPYAEARTIDQILEAVEARPPRGLSELAPGAPAELVAIVAKAMARAPADRYPTAEGLAQDLRRFQAGQLVGAHRYSTWALVRRWIARNRATVATATIAVVALIAFGVVSVRRVAAERDEAERQRARAHRERADAQASRTLAERRFGDSLEELGRQAMMAGAPERALPFLIGAAAAAPAPAPTRELLLGQARAAFAGVAAIAPAHRLRTLTADLAAGDRLLITTAATGELRAWDLAARHVAWEATGIHRAVASPDGRWILAAGDGGEISVRAALDGAMHKTWRLPPAPAGEQWVILRWAIAGDRFALGSTSGRVALGTPDGAALTLGPPHGEEIYTLAFAPGGGALASVAADGGLFVRDPATGAVRAQLRDNPAGSVGCAWLDDARLTSIDGDGTARQWRVATRAVERRFAHGVDPYDLLIDAGGAWMLTYGDRGLAKLWDLRDGSLRASLPGHHIAIYNAAEVGEVLVTSDEAGGVLTWDPGTGAALPALPVEGVLPGLVARGELLVTFGDARPRVWRLARSVPLREVPGHTARVRDLTFDRAGTTVWSASNDGSARGFDLVTGRVIVLGQAGHVEPAVLDAPRDPSALPPSPRGLRSLTLAPDGALVITAGEDGTIGLWDGATGAARGVWRGHTGRVRKVVLTSDGRTAFSVGDSTLRRWDVETGREIGRVELGEPLWDVALLADDTVVATFGDDSRAVGLWSAGSLAAVGPSPAGPNSLRELVIIDDRIVVAGKEHLTMVDATGLAAPPASCGGAFSADGSVGRDGTRMLAVGNSLGEIALYDAKTVRPIRRWRTGDLTVAAVKFRFDGAILASAAGRRVRIWDPATGRMLLESPELPAMITQLVWSPDGRRLAFGGGSGTIWVWDLSPAGTDVERFARCVSMWRLDDSALVTATFDPATCDTLPR